MQTAEWKIITPENVEITFDSDSMAIEFENIRDNFVTELRKTVNNFYVVVDKKINEHKTTKSHIKSRREVFEDLVKINPAVAKLKDVFKLDIDSEPK